MTTACSACLHHIHHNGHLSSNTFTIDHCVLCTFLHNGHLSSNTFTIDHCVLCTFLALPFVAGTLLTVLTVCGFAFSLGYKASYTLCLRKQRVCALRGPPML